VDFKCYNIASHNSTDEIFCSMAYYMQNHLSFEKIKDLAREYILYKIQTEGILCEEIKDDRSLSALRAATPQTMVSLYQGWPVATRNLADIVFSFTFGKKN
jgi:hypothetical protein